MPPLTPNAIFILRSSIVRSLKHGVADLFGPCESAATPVESPFCASRYHSVAFSAWSAHDHVQISLSSFNSGLGIPLLLNMQLAACPPAGIPRS